MTRIFLQGTAAPNIINWVAYIELVEGSKEDFCTGSLINERLRI
jgi:hypothetical protein